MDKLSEVKVWDKWIRSFHWLLTILIPAQVMIAYAGDDAMELHFVLGYIILALWGWRIIWGVVGTRTARFKSFVHSPATVWRFANGKKLSETPPVIGHNPLGGWMVMLMLITLMLQLGSGLFASDGFSTSGPLAAMGSDGFSEFMASIHWFGFLLLSLLITLHILAVLSYWLRGENLIKPMITGRKNISS